MTNNSGSSGRVRGGKKQKIYVATFSGHLLWITFTGLGRGGYGPLATEQA